MTFASWQEWFAWVGVVLPLAILAWSAWQYVALQRRNDAQRKFDNLFRVMDKIGEREGSIASKAAAVYELRNYPEYSEVIVRFCSAAIPFVGGDRKEILQTEFRLTVEHFENKQK